MAEPKREPACKTCNYFVVDTDHPEAGYCHWGPPTRFREYPRPSVTNWPPVEATDWCGQWQLMTKAAAAA